MIYVCHLNRIDIDHNIIYACSIYVIYFEYFVLTYVHSIHMYIYIYIFHQTWNVYVYYEYICLYIIYFRYIS
jgi:hypothetical protein